MRVSMSSVLLCVCVGLVLSVHVSAGSDHLRAASHQKVTATKPVVTKPAVPVKPVTPKPVAPAEPAHAAAHWDYEEADSWSELDETYKVCGSGKRQSPINIKSGEQMVPANTLPIAGVAQIQPTLSPLLINWLPSDVSMYKQNHLKDVDTLVNNGHTIQINTESGSSIFANGKKYDLLQFHFHAPSEHTLNGKHFDMELHAVHKQADGSLLVVGVWFDVGKDGHAGVSDFLSGIEWDKIPSDAGSAPLTAQLNLFDALPYDLEYYTYLGSLTTPPCSEIVTWYVLKQPIHISQEQLDKFSEIFKGNSRPTQPLGGRTISQTTGEVLRR